MSVVAPQGMANNRLPSTGRLAGEEVTVTWDDGQVVRERFLDATTLEWEVVDGPGQGEKATEIYDAVEVAQDVFFVDYVGSTAPLASRTQVLGLASRRALQVVSTVADDMTPGQPRVGQAFYTGVLGDVLVPPAKPTPAPTRDLIGRRAVYRYSNVPPRQCYEHVYLSSRYYCWQCLEGDGVGNGDVDPITVYKFDDDQYVVAWREFRIPVACVWFYNWAALRTTGKFFGLGHNEEVGNMYGGAHITPLASAGYPVGVQPI